MIGGGFRVRRYIMTRRQVSTTKYHETWNSSASAIRFSRGSSGLQSLRITTPDDVRTQLLARADDVIWAMCELPLITLLVTSLGVVNTIMASVRARRWELGVLRTLGVTRWALTRMILAEGLLIGLVACLLSLSFGVMGGWCGTGISQYVSFFGGLATPVVVPWGKLAAALAATLGLCLAASLWPAIWIGRTEPLRLLREGRSTT